MKLTPTRFEITDEHYNQLEATIETVDEAAAKVVIHTVQSPESWTELATWVAEALKLMDLDDAVPKEQDGDPDEYDEV